MTRAFDLATDLMPPLPRRPHAEPRGTMSELMVACGVPEQIVRAGNAVVAPSIDDLYQILASEIDMQPITAFPPDLLSITETASEHVAREAGFRLPSETVLAHERGGTTILTSPNAISGRITSVQDAVRLSRTFDTVVIDERFGPYSTRRLSPLVAEWENVIVLGRLPMATSTGAAPLAWALLPAGRYESLRTMLPTPIDVHAPDVSVSQLRAAIRDTTRLKGQLYRELRKLSIVSVPYPSWANFLLARVERGSRTDIIPALAERGIEVFAPEQANLREHIRITAASAESIAAVKQALIEINLDI